MNYEFAEKMLNGSWNSLKLNDNGKWKGKVYVAPKTTKKMEKLKDSVFYLSLFVSSCLFIIAAYILIA